MAVVAGDPDFQRRQLPGLHPVIGGFAIDKQHRNRPRGIDTEVTPEMLSAAPAACSTAQAACRTSACPPETQNAASAALRPATQKIALRAAGGRPNAASGLRSMSMPSIEGEAIAREFGGGKLRPHGGTWQHFVVGIDDVGFQITHDAFRPHLQPDRSRFRRKPGARFDPQPSWPQYCSTCSSWFLLCKRKWLTLPDRSRLDEPKMPEN
jgi:hypothetical protein